MATPHNKAELHDIAPVVLLPGDPLRAQYVAEQYLENSRQVTGVRNMLGFTGTYQGIPVSVMGSGMGGPSAGIYSYELFSFYGVERIIRIGTAGGLQENTKPGTLVFAITASTDSRFAYQYQLPGTYSPCASFNLFQKAVEIAQKNKMLFTAGGIFSSDMFSSYNALGEKASWEPWAKMNCLAQDMETYALYCTAAYLKKQALSVLTVTDSCVTGDGLPAEERITALEPMFTVALETARQTSR